MRVEVINTGTELLLGQVVNTHVTFLARACRGWACASTGR